jgi:hypothetical protein
MIFDRYLATPSNELPGYGVYFNELGEKALVFWSLLVTFGD